MMRTVIFLAGLSVAGGAQADWVPRVLSDQYLATVSYGGGVLSYGEDAKAMGPLRQVATQLQGLSADLQQALNGPVAQLVAQNGASFQSGTVSGNAQLTISPDASGVAHIVVSGLGYQVRSQYSGKKWGVIHYTCTNTLTLSNLVVSAQYGTAGGNMQDDKTGVTATTSSSTDCDSNLSWILPGVGDVLIGKAQDKINGLLLSNVQAQLAKVKDTLLYRPDQNMLNGLSRLVPPGKVVTLPGGGAFPLGQYLQNNLAYLLGNSQLSIQLGNLIAPGRYMGDGRPSVTSASADVVAITLSSPAMSFSVKVSENIGLTWGCVPIHMTC
ncbi:hypothetical protein [Chromobacterium sp. ATCC 53434]|uniref:hypothetical protein n=1 Tax=Chromobacterium sp. (strain ATCC 53434 / SC 14030) TaxID=2059672 RepID=UPI0018F217FF|nr:hypothetical protein [Chromobacterium sp. ATCC 53434]